MPDHRDRLIEDLTDIVGDLQLDLTRATARAETLEHAIRAHRHQVLAEHVIVQQPQDARLWRVLEEDGDA